MHRWHASKTGQVLAIDITSARRDDTTVLQLEELVRQHAGNFPWYAELLAERGLRPGALLEKLPIIDEQLLLTHYYTQAHEQFADASGYLTSGTSGGKRKRVLYSPDDDDDYAAQRRALFADFLGPVGPGAVAVADLGTGHAAALARRIFGSLGYDTYDIDFTRPVDEHVGLLNKWRPDVLFTMPMILDQLVAAPAGLDIHPRKIMVVGDLAPAAWRRRVAKRFGIGFEDVLDVFGSIEVGAIGHYCADTGLYHFHDHILPEVITPGDLYKELPAVTQPARGSGILLLTSFARRYFPALRFATNDLITGLRTIEWRGRRVYAFERIDGRFGGEAKHGERISHHDICTAVGEVFPGAPFEVVNDGLMEIRVATTDLTPERSAVLRGLLRAAAPDIAQMIDSGIVADIAVRAVRPEDLHPTRSKRLFTLRES